MSGPVNLGRRRSLPQKGSLVVGLRLNIVLRESCPPGPHRCDDGRFPSSGPLCARLGSETTSESRGRVGGVQELGTSGGLGGGDRRTRGESRSSDEGSHDGLSGFRLRWSDPRPLPRHPPWQSCPVCHQDPCDRHQAPALLPPPHQTDTRHDDPRSPSRGPPRPSRTESSSGPHQCQCLRLQPTHDPRCRRRSSPSNRPPGQPCPSPPSPAHPDLNPVAVRKDQSRPRHRQSGVGPCPGPRPISKRPGPPSATRSRL